jgi:hypothetical protein
MYPIGIPFGYVGAPAVPEEPVPSNASNTVEREVHAMAEQSRESRLHSSRDVSGYHIAATDGDLGHVDDFVIDEENWFIRYIVVDTGGWLSGRKVLVIPEWIESIHWEERRVYVNLSRDDVEHSPAYEPEEFITREYETRIFDNYRRPAYWEDVPDTERRGERR